MSEKFADFEGEVDRKMWEQVSGKITTPRATSALFVRSSLAVITAGLLGLYLYWPISNTGTILLETPGKMVSMSAPENKTTEDPTAQPTSIHPTSTEEISQPNLISNKNTPSGNAETTGHSTITFTSDNHSEIYLPEPKAAVEQKPIGGFKFEMTEVVRPDKNSRHAWINVAAGSFVNYKNISPNRFDNTSLTNFNSGKSFDLNRLGYHASATITFPRPRFDIETGFSYSHFRSSISFDERSIASDRATRTEINSVYNVIGLRGALHFPSRHGKLMTGLEWQSLKESGTTPGRKNLLAARVGYSFNVFSPENTNLVIRPIVSYSLTTINMGTMRSRPYTVGVEAVFSRKVKRSLN